jgi:hypothetical protein
MKTHFTVDLVIYPFDIMFSLGEEEGEIREFLGKGYEMEQEDVDELFNVPLAQGRCYHHASKGWTFIRLKHFPEDPKVFGYLQHEIFHAVTFIMNKIGMSFDLNVSDEAYAYLIGYVTEQAYLNINEVKSKVFQEFELEMNWEKQKQEDDLKMEQLKAQSERV